MLSLLSMRSLMRSSMRSSVGYPLSSVGGELLGVINVCF